MTQTIMEAQQKTKTMARLQEQDYRQQIYDMTSRNPRTGLPKHVYHYDHSECTLPAFRGTFQMRGKKYHTDRVPYDPSVAFSRQEAIDKCVELLEELRQAVGWYDFVENQEYHGRRSKKFGLSY